MNSVADYEGRNQTWGTTGKSLEYALKNSLAAGTYRFSICIIKESETLV